MITRSYVLPSARSRPASGLRVNPIQRILACAAAAWKATPIVWRGHRRPLSAADLLAAVAMVAFVSGVALALVASDLSLAGEIPLWNAAVVVSVLAVLVSVLVFPDWWTWTGGWGTTARACAGARERHASHTVDLRKARSPRARRGADVYGAHRIHRARTGVRPAGRTRRSQAVWLLEARRRDRVPRLQRQHGRPRG